MNTENKNVTSLPHVEIERIAQITSGVEPLQIPASLGERTQSDERKKKSGKVGKWLAAGALALVGTNWLTGGLSGQETDQPEKTLLEHAEDAPRKSIDIDDKSMIFTVEVNKKETPAEAVFTDSRVKEYIIDNPDEAATIKTSANSLPSMTNEIALVEKDLDSDGNMDTFVAPIEKD